MMPWNHTDFNKRIVNPTKRYFVTLNNEILGEWKLVSGFQSTCSNHVMTADTGYSPLWRPVFLVLHYRHKIEMGDMQLRNLGQ